MPYLHDDMILTDVGSVKTPIHDEIIRLGLEDYFIGGHPMAGSEKSGFANSKPILIENAYFVLTPSAKVAKKGGCIRILRRILACTSDRTGLS